MKRIISLLILSFVTLTIVLTSGIIVQAQNDIESQLTGPCKSALGAKINLFGSITDLINPQSSLPFTPKECGKDISGKSTAIPVKYFPLVLLRVYKFLISLSLYLFAFGLILLGVMIQADIFSGNYDYMRKIRSYFKNAITGLLTTLFAYFIVMTILWIFNIDQRIIGESILK
jgi:hypothetical protein